MLITGDLIKSYVTFAGIQAVIVGSATAAFTSFFNAALPATELTSPLPMQLLRQG